MVDQPDLDTDNYQGNIINNRFVPGDYDKSIRSPRDRKWLPRVHLASQHDLNEAVEYARKAQVRWCRVKYEKRRRGLFNFTMLLVKNSWKLAQAYCIETGKPIQIAVEEIQTAIRLIKERTVRPPEESEVSETPNRIDIIRYEPLGVCAAVLPAEWPILFAASNIAAALITGNTIILKPNINAPYCCLKLGELAGRAVPPSVVQVLHGDLDLQGQVHLHDGINMSLNDGNYPDTFVGIRREFRNRRVHRETQWGYGAVIVCDDIDIAAWVPQLVIMALVNNGQSGSLAKRIYVHEKIYQQVRDKIVSYITEEIVCGDPIEPSTHVGAVQGPVNFQLCENALDEIDQEGFETVLRGKADQTKGFYVEPTIVDNPPDHAKLVTQPPPGPIISLHKWSQDMEVVQRVNAIPIDIGVCVAGNDTARIQAIASKLAVEFVSLNWTFKKRPDKPMMPGKILNWGIEQLVMFARERIHTKHFVKKCYQTRWKHPSDLPSQEPEGSQPPQSGEHVEADELTGKEDEPNKKRRTTE